MSKYDFIKRNKIESSFLYYTNAYKYFLIYVGKNPTLRNHSKMKFHETVIFCKIGPIKLISTEINQETLEYSIIDILL